MSLIPGSQIGQIHKAAVGRLLDPRDDCGHMRLNLRPLPGG